MFNHRPHTISITWQAEATQDDNLDWSGSGPASFDGLCRAIPAGTKTIKLSDGKDVIPSHKVFLDRMTIDIPYGAKATLDIDGKLITQEVLDHHNYQTYSMLWL